MRLEMCLMLMQVFWTLRLKATQVSRNMIKGNQSYFNYRVFISWVHTVLLNLKIANFQVRLHGAINDLIIDD